MSISAAMFVFPFFIHPQTSQRVWISSLESKRDTRTGRLILWPNLDDDPTVAQKFRYDYALVMQRRFREELPPQYDVRFAVGHPNGEEAERVINNSTISGDRTPQHYRGLVIRPFNPTGWCCKLRDDSGERESVRGETPEEVGDKVIERGLFEIAEKAPAPPPEPPKTQQAPYRKRPGSI